MDEINPMEYISRVHCNMKPGLYGIWQSFIERIGREDIEQLTRSTASAIRLYLDRGELDAEEAVKEILSFVNLDDCMSLDRTSIKCTRLLLLEALDICASYLVPNRLLTRTILARLYSYNNKIDREVIYCEFNRSKFADRDIPTVFNRKLKYILDNVAGWRINCIDDDFYLSSRTEYYLELPLMSRQGNDEESYIITDALYQHSDPSYVLLLLRHGMPASCVHLWPIIMSFDLRLTLSSDLVDPEVSVSTWQEMRMLRYFCRARASFTVHVVLGETEEKAPLMARYEDTLIVSPSVKPYIPTDRYKHPASLQHHCRLTIRNSLLLADNLPRGIPTLSLPQVLKDFVDLLAD